MRLQIFGLIGGAMAPILLFSGALIVRSAIREQSLIISSLQKRTDAVADNLGRDINILQQPLYTLGASAALANGDFARFHDQAVRLTARTGWNLSLSDRQGKLLVNTRSDSGDGMRSAGYAASAVKAIMTGRPTLSDFTVSAIDGRPGVALSVPVSNDGCMECALNLNIINVVNAALMSQVAFNEGYGAVLDSTGKLIARQPPIPEALGKSATPTALSMISQANRGTFRSLSRGGIPTFSAFSRVGMTGWTVSLSIPETVLAEPIATAVWTILPIGLATLLVALAISGTLGRRLTRNMRDLANAAAALGQAIPIALPRRTGIGEIDAVSRAIVQASDIIRSRTAERENAVAALHLEAKNRRDAEERLIQTQKMEAIGRLTSGISHDFNNILGTVVISLEGAERLMPHGAGQKLLNNAIDAALRGGDLTRRLLAFARQQPLTPRPIDLNEVAAAMTPLLARTLGGAITVSVSPARTLWPALADRSQVQDALLNLSINARDAMPNGGELLIATANARLTSGRAGVPQEVSSGDYVALRVIDNGVGMSPDILSRVLEPFFTTKPEGHGSGLGLSMVYGFVHQSAGHLDIKSAPGRGTTVTIYLPRAQNEVASPASVANDEPQGHGECILVVEDYEGIRHAAVWTLKDLGYQTLEACDGQQALAILHSDAAIDLLFTDIIMPGGIDGRALADQAQALRPGLAVLLASGNNGRVGEKDVIDNFVVLPKPYRRFELALRIRAALDDAGSPTDG